MSAFSWPRSEPSVPLPRGLVRLGVGGVMLKPNRKGRDLNQISVTMTRENAEALGWLHLIKDEPVRRLAR